MDDYEFFFDTLPSGFAPRKQELLPLRLLLFCVIAFLFSMLGVAIVTELVPIISVALLLSPPVGGYLSNVLVAVAVLLAVVLGIIISSTLVIVPQGFVLLTLTFGRRQRKCNPGIRWLFPLIERPVVWANVQRRSMFVDANDALGKDNISVNVKAALFFTTTDPLLAYFEVSNLKLIIRRNVEAVIREFIAFYPAVQLDDTSGNLRQNLGWFLQRRLAFLFEHHYGVRIDGAAVTDFVITNEEVLSQVSQVMLASIGAKAREIGAGAVNNVLEELKAAITQNFPSISEADFNKLLKGAYNSEILREFATSKSGSPTIPVFNVPNPTDSGKED